MHCLSDLPSELLCHISRNLRNEELLVLCQVSKQLHFAALTVYFDRFEGVYAPTNAPAIICQPSLLALRGLLLALWVKKCHSVCCTLTTYKQFLYFIRFMSKLEPFRKLHLRFARGMEPETRKIIYVLIDLMIVIKHKGCEDMLITGGHTERAWVPGVTDLTRALRLESVVSTVDTVGRFFRRLFRRHKRDETYWITVTPSLTTLKTVTVTTDYFFTSYMSTWTIRTLNDSSITSLTLDLRFGNVPKWTHILSLLRLRHLREFVISCDSLSLQCLTQFLRRHNGITSLTTKGLLLGDNETYDKSALTVTALPKLQRLAGLPNDIRHILRLKPSFKALQYVIISDPDADGYITSLNDCLDAMAARDKSYVTSIAIKTEHTSWLLSQSNGDSERSIPHVSSLAIVWTGQRDELPPPSFTAALGGWVALFPDLEHLHWGVKRDLEGSQAERNIATTIIKHCPRLKTLELLKDPHVPNRQPPAVDVWRRDDPLAIQQLAWSQNIQRRVASCSCYEQKSKLAGA
ncbi:hypothetical protein K503DRAFT_766087 [Rhizopogon vinicolor AM-OR11-026]|uniref:F-box domain-containing protein n=1 Tax=Rhizopogon vinicolor AM-OR11-026 TaxID=1314800 RepID=A0A1B7NEM8_9AGAM|nr:hypothetical protein K503DRAFT_766087 [Rhizopogon vinicolor AM-OR11-026]